MSTLRAPTTTVNRNPGTAPYAVLFAPAMVADLRNPRFGFGLAPGRRLPIGPSASDAAEIMGACPSTAYTDAEWAQEFARRTMSREERRDFLAEIRSAELDRYARCDSAEWDELGIDPARMDDLAGTADAVDRMSAGYPLF